jgi:signal peptidase I
MEPNKTISPAPGPASPPQPPQADYIPIRPQLPPTPPPAPSNEGAKSILSTLAILIAAPIVAFMLTAFVFQSYEVDGPSMETTLQNHDRLLVLKVPKTLARITGGHYIPNRGDVIIFSTTGLHETDSDNGRKQLIKRVVGVPGDRVVIKDGSVTVYNKQFPEGFNPDKAGDYSDVIQVTPGAADITIKENEVFVLGDNRTNSLDSRVIGTISADDIIGKLIFRIYPLNNAQVF